MQMQCLSAVYHSGLKAIGLQEAPRIPAESVTDGLPHGNLSLSCPRGGFVHSIMLCQLRLVQIFTVQFYEPVK